MGNFRGGFGGGFGGGANIGALMKQAQKMQEDMQKQREEIDSTEFSAKVGGGMVEVIFMGDKTLKSIKINPEIVDKDDVEMLEDLISAGVNDAMSQIKRAEEEKMPSMPKGF